MFELRPIRPADVSAVSVMLRRSFGQLLRDDYAPAVLDASLDAMSGVRDDLLGCGTYFIAHDAGAILGAGGWTGHVPTGDAGATDAAHVRKLAVHPDALRRGVGRALMVHIHRTAKAAGKTQMHCLSSLSAVSFYAAAGYVDLGRGQIPTADPALPFAVVEMWRRL